MAEINRTGDTKFNMFEWFKEAKKYYENLPKIEELDQMNLRELLVIRGVIEDKLDFMNKHNKKDNELLGGFNKYQLELNELIDQRIKNGEE